MKGFIIKQFTTLFFLTVILVLQAQQGCPQENPGAIIQGVYQNSTNVSLPCGVGCAQVVANAFQTGNTSAYTVSQIPYNPFPFNGGTPILVASDDEFSDTITLPFNFCFFNNNFTQVVVSSNGTISFNSITNALGFNTWTIPGPIPFLLPADLLNSIMGPWQDIDPFLGGSINWQLTGAYPCRILVVNWVGIPMFNSNSSISNCATTTPTTAQIVMYETTNVIEVNIQNKDACTDWNSGFAIEGILDATGATAYSVPGRNATVWTAQNDAWRFTPNGPSIVTVNWFQGGTPIGTGDTISVCPSQASTTYTCVATYQPCAGGPSVVVSDSITVGLAGSLLAGIDSFRNVSCTGSGAIYASASTANPPLNFGWNNGATTLAITGLAVGTYVFTASDASGCTRADTVTLTQASPLTLDTTSLINNLCNGANTGSISVFSTGASGIYTFTWSNGQTGATATNLAAGSYTVTSDDGSGCTITGTWTITEPPVLSIDSAQVTNIPCTPAPIGAITAFVSGGTGPYLYSWLQQSNSAPYSGQTISNLAGDTYNLTVSDANGCTATASYVITQSTILAITTSSGNVSCFGGTNGFATVAIQNGTPPYTYNWNGTGAGPNDTLFTAAGTINVTVNDANCSATATFTITEPPALVITQLGIGEVSCFGGNNGTDTVSVSGGTPGYTFLWSSGSIDTVATGLSSGQVSFTITDANGCVDSLTGTITQPLVDTVTLVSQTNVSCNGGTNGTITVLASGGTPGYAYLWSDGQTGATATGLTAGTITVVSTDNLLCTASQTYTILEPTPLIISQVTETEVSCFGLSDGTESVMASGATPNYNYLWSNAQTGPDATGLPAGPVSVTVTDANGCANNASYTITQPALLVISQVSETEVNCFGGSDGTETVTATGGTLAYNFAWSNGQTGVMATALSSGPITVTVTDANSCTDVHTYNITQPTQVVALTVVVNTTCFQTPNGSITVSASNGTPPYNYAWNNGQSGSMASNLLSGVYICTVSDMNNCSISVAAQVNEPSDIVLSATSTRVNCMGDANGTITPAATGGTLPYIFSATKDNVNFFYAVNGVITGLTTGTYNVIVTDSNNCSKTIPETVGDASPDNFLTSTDSTYCFGPDYNDGAAHIVATTIQNGPYTFSIDGGVFGYSGDFTGLSAGVHSITATNYYGCQTKVPVEVFEPLPVIAFVTPDTLNLNLGESGTVLVTYLNAANPGYNWTPGNGLSCVDCPNPTVMVYNRGDYKVTVSYVNHNATCFGTALLHVNILDTAKVFIPNCFTPNGDGNNDLFLIFGQDIKTASVKIFNRWGEKVFETTNHYEGWDGRYKGQMQNPGVFTYEAEITLLDDRKIVKAGAITLMR